MGNRDYKDFAKGKIVHVYNRGNNKEKIFLDNQDYKAFLLRLGLALGFNENDLIKEKLISMPHSRIRITSIPRGYFKLHAFCLMPNHFHLIIEQTKDDSISKLISKICTSYAKYLNKKHKRVGHVFQYKFKAVTIEDNPQLMWTSAYIHMNPVKDHLIDDPKKYMWSSYSDFVSNRNLPITDTELIMGVFGNKNNFETETLRLASDK